MASYVTYKWSKDGEYLVPDPFGDPFSMQDDPMTIEDLLAMDFIPKELPVDHGDGQIEMELCFVDSGSEDDLHNTLIYGPDDHRNYQVEEELPDPPTPEMAKSILHTSKGVDPKSFFKKSLYNFDLNSIEGINNVLESLPIMDPVILRQIAEEIWPGIDTSIKDPQHLREEVKGYLMDHLHSQNALED